MQDFEKLGALYLGRIFDLEQGRTKEDLLLYDSKDLTTHGVCVGMTGSGKTGLCISLLEEAAIDGIPSLIIDPKGDLGNMLLAFPELKPADFRPWIDADEAVHRLPDCHIEHFERGASMIVEDTAKPVTQCSRVGNSECVIQARIAAAADAHCGDLHGAIPCGG